MIRQRGHAATSVYVVALDQGLLSTVAGPLEVFRLAGLPSRELSSNQTAPLFQVQLVAQPGRLRAFGEVELNTADVTKLPRPDIVFLGSAGFNLDSVACKHSDLGRLLVRWHEAGSVVAAVCTGVIVLAECGLLTKRRATTHWAIRDWFRSRYRQVRLHDAAMVTQQARVWCGAGGHAALDLALELVGRFAGAQVALEVGQTLLLDAPRHSQTPYRASTQELNHDDDAIARVQRKILLDLAHPWTIDELADFVCISKRSLLRRFRLATGTTLGDYLQTLRMEEAKRLLIHSTQRISDIAPGIGYQDQGFFRLLFKRKTGLAPRDYRRKFASPPVDGCSRLGEG